MNAEGFPAPKTFGVFYKIRPVIPVSQIAPTGGDENYNRGVARGWESKGVEAQQAEASADKTKKRPKMSAAEAERFRQKESLRLSRQRVQQQLQASQNPRHREMLERSIAELERRLRELGE